MNIITTEANKYSRPGTVIAIDDSLGELLIAKGFAKRQHEAPEQVEEKEAEEEIKHKTKTKNQK